MRKRITNVEQYCAYLKAYNGYFEERLSSNNFELNYDFDLERRLIEQCEAGDYIHTDASTIRDDE